MINDEFKIVRKWIGSVVLLFIVLALLHTCDQTDAPTQNTEGARASAADVKPALPAEIPISNVAWETIDAIYGSGSRETELSKDEKWKEFNGKRVRWTGEVTTVSDSLGILSMDVKMTPESKAWELFVMLRESERSNALLLKEGDTVTFTGTLSSWGELISSIKLTDGAIDKSPPSSPPDSTSNSGPTEEETQALFKAALGGDSAAQMALSTHYFWGHGAIQKDYTESIHWARIAAAEGNPSALQFIETIKTIIFQDPARQYSEADKRQMANALQDHITVPPELYARISGGLDATQ